MDIHIMTELTPYSNREIDEWRDDTSNSLQRIEKKVDFTNGKVADLIRWKERATGAGWAFGACLVLIIVPLAAWTLYNQVSEPARIQASVASYFDENYSNIQILHDQQ